MKKQSKKFMKWGKVGFLSAMAIVLAVVSSGVGPAVGTAHAFSYSSTYFDGGNTQYTDVYHYWYTPARTIQENLQSVYVYFHYSEGDTNPTVNNCAKFRVRFFPRNGSASWSTSWMTTCEDLTNPGHNRTELANRILKGTLYRVEQVSVKSLDFAPVFTLRD